MRKNAALLVILILIVSGIMIATPACAAVPKPSVPEFTVKLVNSPYNVTTTDPYTGVNVTQQFDNNTIQVRIKNQPFAYSINGLTYHLYYNIRTKPHLVGNWTELYPVLEQPNSPYNPVSKSFSYSKYLFGNFPSQSNSDYTVLSLPAEYPSNAQVDFQVEAIVGHDSQVWYVQHPLTPEYGGYYEPAIAFDDASNWSNTQTITIDASVSTTTPTASTLPSQSPSATSEPSPIQTGGLFGLGWEKTALIVLAVVVVALVVAVVVLWHKKAAK